MNIIPKPNSVTHIKGKKVKIAKSFIFNGDLSANLETDFASFFDKTAINCDNTEALTITLQKVADLHEEEYSLTADDSVTITATCDKGLFYGLQTLKQLIFDYWVTKNTDIPSMVILDKAYYPYRGYMLDVSRHFFSVEDVINLIDILAMHKINKLHMHVTDDQGWRVEIKSYPLLTKIGSYRKHTLGDGIEYGGFFTQNDISKIVEYANSKFIEVIPEIDLPGHFTAAIASYPELSCKNQKIEVATSFGIKTDIACAGKEEVYTFFEKVIDEMAALFNSEFIHIGGDEAPKNMWEECDACQAMIKAQGLNSVEELQGYMVNRIASYIESKGKSAIVWNESLNSGILKESVICQYWSDGKEPKRVLKGINSGRLTIISKFSPYYLDYPFGMHSLKSIYSFNPELNGAERLENIMGIESPLWTEYVKDKAKIDYQTFPRLTAMSEIAWSLPKNRDYEDFEIRLKAFYPLYSFFNVTPAPLSVVNPNKIQGIGQIIKFLKGALTKESVKAFFSSYKAAKKVKSTRIEE